MQDDNYDDTGDKGMAEDEDIETGGSQGREDTENI